MELHGGSTLSACLHGRARVGEARSHPATHVRSGARSASRPAHLRTSSARGSPASHGPEHKTQSRGPEVSIPPRRDNGERRCGPRLLRARAAHVDQSRWARAHVGAVPHSPFRSAGNLHQAGGRRDGRVQGQAGQNQQPESGVERRTEASRRVSWVRVRRHPTLPFHPAPQEPLLPGFAAAALSQNVLT